MSSSVGSGQSELSLLLLLLLLLHMRVPVDAASLLKDPLVGGLLLGTGVRVLPDGFKIVLKATDPERWTTKSSPCTSRLRLLKSSGTKSSDWNATTMATNHHDDDDDDDDDQDHNQNHSHDDGIVQYQSIIVHVENENENESGRGERSRTSRHGRRAVRYEWICFWLGRCLPGWLAGWTTGQLSCLT